MPFFVDLQLATAGAELPDPGELERFSEIELQLAEKSARLAWVSFLGNEIGGGGMTLSWEAEKPAVLLRLCHRLMTKRGLDLNTVRVSIRSDVDLPAAAGEFPLGEYERGLAAWLAEQRAKPKKRVRHPKIGDYYAIPLPDGRWGHGFYAIKEAPWGDFLQVLDLVTAEPAELPMAVAAPPLFPPIGVYVLYAVRDGGWKFIGNHVSGEPFVLPLMRGSNSVNFTQRPGEHDDWFVYNCTERHFVGKLPLEMRRLECFAAWTAEGIAKRIMTGENPYDAFY